MANGDNIQSCSLLAARVTGTTNLWRAPLSSEAVVGIKSYPWVGVLDLDRTAIQSLYNNRLNCRLTSHDGDVVRTGVAHYLFIRARLSLVAGSETSSYLHTTLRERETAQRHAIRRVSL